MESRNQRLGWSCMYCSMTGGSLAFLIDPLLRYRGLSHKPQVTPCAAQGARSTTWVSDLSLRVQRV